MLFLKKKFSSWVKNKDKNKVAAAATNKKWTLRDSSSEKLEKVVCRWFLSKEAKILLLGNLIQGRTLVCAKEYG